MTTEPTESDEARSKGGRPRRYPRDRITATVRFTRERTADLRAEATAHGRSLSQEIEYRVEDYARMRKLLDAMSASRDRRDRDLADTNTMLDDSHATIGELCKRIEELQQTLALTDQRIAEIVATAVTRALMEKNR
jgi:hypothetical protein